MTTRHFVNGDGEAMFKVVVTAYEGAMDWAQRVVASLCPDAEITTNESAGWGVSLFNYRLPSEQIDARAIRIHVFAHEGMFFGQPQRAKVVVYKNAHAVVGLASAEDAKNHLESLEGDLQLMADQDDLHPFAKLFVASTAAESHDGTGSATVPVEHVDWHASPAKPLEDAVAAIVARARL